MPSEQLQLEYVSRIVGRVDFRYQGGPAPIVLDRRGQIAAAGNATGLFPASSVEPNRVLMRGPLFECEIGLFSAGVIWRDNLRQNDLLEFVGKLLSSMQIRVAGFRQICTFYRPETRPFRDMVLAMRDGMRWAMFRTPEIDETVDVGAILEVKIDESVVNLSLGPMEQWQLIRQSFGDQTPPPEMELPERAWFLQMVDKGDYELPSGMSYESAKRFVTARLARWNDFAEEFIKGMA